MQHQQKVLVSGEAVGQRAPCIGLKLTFHVSLQLSGALLQVELMHALSTCSNANIQMESSLGQVVRANGNGTVTCA